MTHLAICRLDAYASEEFEELARTAEELLDAFATGDAAVGDGNLDATRAALGASTAGEAAGRPGRPGGNDAVHRAGVAVACLGSAEHGAGDAAVGNSSGDGTGTLLGA